MNHILEILQNNTNKSILFKIFIGGMSVYFLYSLGYGIGKFIAYCIG